MVSKLQKLKASTNTSAITALSNSVAAAKSHDSRSHTDFISTADIQLDPHNARELHVTIDDVVNGLKQNDPLLDIKQQELESLISLSKTIKERGLINPIVVYQFDRKYILISGERRTLASLIAKQSVIKATIYEVKPDELEVSLLQYIENIERENYTLWENICGIKRIVSAKTNKENKKLSDFSATELSELISKSINTASKYLTLLKANNKLIDKIKTQEINNVDKAVFIATAPEHLTDMLIRECVNGASLEKLKLISKEENKKRAIKPKESMGRPIKNIQLGITQKPKVVKIIFDAIANQQEVKVSLDDFEKVNWEDFKQATQAFKKLIAILEKQV